MAGDFGNVLVDGSHDSSVANALKNQLEGSVQCPSGPRGVMDRCIGSVDVDTGDSGWSTPLAGAELDINVHSVRDSASACETYNSLADGDSIRCSPGPNFDVCGAYTGDEVVHMEGPEVDGDVMEGYQAHREACVNFENPSSPHFVSSGPKCVIHDREDGTKLVDEGRVADVAPYLILQQYQYPSSVGL